MTEHVRTAEAALEVGAGRTIYGIAVPYGQAMEITPDLTESFTRGAFDHQLRAADRVWFAREHIKLGGKLIGKVLALRDDPEGLYFEARASNTPDGNDTLELVRDKALRHVSIMFRERQNRRLGGTMVERVKADLREIAMVLEGAYGDFAAAAGVRSAASDETPPGELVTPLRDRADMLRLPDLSV